MDRFFYRIQKFISKRSLLFTAVLIIAFSLLSIAALRLSLSENVSKILPKSQGDDQLSEILENISFTDRLFFNISLTDSNTINPILLIDYSTELNNKLLRNQPYDIKKIQLQIEDKDVQMLSDYVLSNIPFLLFESDYHHIDQIIKPEHLEKNFRKKYKTLLSPASIFLKQIILKDPVGISSEVLKRLRSFQLDQSIQIKRNYLFTEDDKHLIFYLIPNQPASNTKINSQLIQRIYKSIDELNQKYQGKVNAEIFGASLVAVGNAEQIKKDIILTVSLALIAIVVLIALFFKSKRLYAIIFLPAILAVVSSMAILYVIKGEISAIALGMGSLLVGISIDYVLHIFTHYQNSGSIKKTLKDVSEPIIISAATTATAFFGLLIVSAPALQDMGIFAGISILFSAVFSLILIPVFLKKPLSKGNKKTQSDNILSRSLNRITNYSFHKNKYIILFIIILSPIFYYFSLSVNFQGDMNAINFMEKTTKEAEKHLNSITQLSQRNIFIVSSGTNLNQALLNAESIEQRLSQLQKDSLLLQYTSIPLLLPSKDLQQQKLRRWNTFWSQEKKDSLFTKLEKIEQEYHFKKGAFNSFYQLINKDYQNISFANIELIKEHFLSDLLQTGANKQYVITQIKTSSNHKHQLHQVLESELGYGQYIIDKEYLTNKFVNDLKNDFHRLVNLSLLLVFLIIWISFGRIELAIITYTPLLLSWIWTMGMMSIFHIEFNIVNIIISSFIFGLGIDYSIFITRGLTQEYKYGYKTSASFKKSILFSAITTIIGIGVLIFAKHPALKSMAAVTVIGLISVLFLSFSLQALLFNWLVYLPNGKKRVVPVTATNLLGSFVALLVFSLGSLFNTISGFFLITLTAGKSKTTRLWFHHLLRASSWVMIWVMFNVKKKVNGWNHSKFRKPSVIISNHQSHIDIMLMLMLHPKIILLTNDWVQRNFFYGKIVKMADFYPILDHLHEHIDLLKKKIEEGYSIMIFPEGTRSETGKIGRFHKGAFYLAEQLDIDILPIILHGPGDCITKGEPYLKNGRIDIKIGDPIPISDKSFGIGYVERSKKFRKWYQEEYRKLQESIDEPKYMRKRVELNYIYKGPVLEWYGKIKMNFEKNYQFFHEQIPAKAKIIDLGCGNGFMDYMLLFLSNDRQIIGVDFDEDKILTAQNCNGYQQFNRDHIRFYASDLMDWTYEAADVYVIMDTLHYMPFDEQEYVIQQAVRHLNNGGKIIIRDADTDLEKKHKGTKFSEWQSTKLFGFNKTKDENKQLYFGSAKKTIEVLEKLGMQVQIIDKTKYNSNSILIATKQFSD